MDTQVHFKLRSVSPIETELVLVHEGFEGVSAILTSFILQLGWKTSLLSKKLPATLARLSSRS